MYLRLNLSLPLCASTLDLRDYPHSIITNICLAVTLFLLIPLYTVIIGTSEEHRSLDQGQ